MNKNIAGGPVIYVGNDDMLMERGRSFIDVMDTVLMGLPARIGILFSGGVDSGLLAALSRRRSVSHLYTVGVRGAPDLVVSKEAAACLGLPWTPIVLGLDDIEEHCRTLLGTVSPDDPVTLSFELPLHIVASMSSEGDLVTGQGADELFMGYSRYLSMSPTELAGAREADLARVVRHVVPLERRIAALHGKIVWHPFLDDRLVELAMGIPAGEMMVGRVRKAPLRQAAELLDMGTMASREKKAAQYGSGIMKALKAGARGRSLTLNGYLAELAAENGR